ncbi:MAG: D-alanyl-D-alanine carboxypeptidase/D-alanyl-D-alanine-endopeptidase [Labilithrix sp.]|nr:D-alanyl-D-alanine carboxypeptidase/D-alanyl-D-alanine-endopeptidase [Labilithrix sp.]
MRARAGMLSLLGLCAVLLAGSGARSEPPAPPSASATARAPEIEAAVRALVGDHALKNAQIGVVVMDCDSGAILAQSGEHVVLNPASNAKLYTAAAALAILHGSHRYQTTLNGTIKSGTATNLVLRGHGDPSLETKDLWALVQELKRSGARRVEGDITVDQKFFDEQTTPPAFEQQPNEWAAFRAPVSAVAINENTVTLTVRPQAAGVNAIVSFDPPGFVDVEGTIKTAESGADNVGLDLSGGNKRRLSAKVSGAVGADSRLVRYTRRVEDPQLLAGYALKAALEESGLKVAGEVKLGGQATKGGVLARHESEPLSTLLYALGKSSDNFYAEMVFKSIAAEAKSRPGKSQDSAEMVARWIDKNDLGDTGVVVKNGSGLFDANRTTAHSLAKLLRWAWRDPEIHSEFVSQLAIGGIDGTLHRRFRDIRAHRSVRAKSGTLDDAIALSGYVLGPPGKGTIAFSIVFNKVSGRGAAARAAADKLVELIHDRQWR